MKKSILLSKTFYIGVVTALAPLFPAIKPFLTEHLGTIGMVWGALIVVVRLVTKDKVVLLP